MNSSSKVHFHLPGLFQFYTFYKKFLPLFFSFPQYFYDWCDIGSVYGSPFDCLWGGGRVENGEEDYEEVFKLFNDYKISSCLTFSNSLLENKHLSDKKCNTLCKIFSESDLQNGIIIYSDLLKDYIKNTYPKFYFVSSTTKVLTDFKDFKGEIDNKDFRFVVPDFRLNRQFQKFKKLNADQKAKVEFLCNECCFFGCQERKKCYENVSRKNLGLACEDFKCSSPYSKKGYVFSDAMKNPGFISVDDIKNIYFPQGFTNFKIEGRGLGSAILLEFILYYMTKPECQLKVREEIYLDNMLDLF